MSRSDDERLRDIVFAAQRLAEITADGRKAFDSDWVRSAAAEPMMLVIGEAASKLSDEAKSAHEDGEARRNTTPCRHDVVETLIRRPPLTSTNTKHAPNSGRGHHEHQALSTLNRGGVADCHRRRSRHRRRGRHHGGRCQMPADPCAKQLLLVVLAGLSTVSPREQHTYADERSARNARD